MGWPKFREAGAAPSEVAGHGHHRRPGVLELVARYVQEDWVPPLLIGCGVLVGPAVGHFYAGRPSRAWLGIGVRVAGLAGGLAIVAATMNDPDPPPVAWIAGIAAGGITVGSTGVDMVTAPGSARAHNEQTGWAPVGVCLYLPGGSGLGAAGRLTF